MTDDTPTTELTTAGVIELDAPPSLPRLLAKAPLAARQRSRGLPDVHLLYRDVAVDRDHLARYDRVCGFTVRDALPATFPHVLAFPLQVKLMVDHPFPLALPKLIHVGNRITLRRLITADEPISVQVRAENLRPHPKGATVDLVADASVDGEAVWHGVSTYLQPGGSAGEAGGPEGGEGAPVAAEGAPAAAEGGPAAAEPTQPLATEPAKPVEGEADLSVPDEPAALWKVPRDIGRRYAAVSGDYNPIHLNPAPAKLAGFPRTIAHGMWTKARSLAAVEPRLPQAYTVDVAFKKPIVVPATVGFHTEVHGDTRAIAVRDPKRGAPHLLGTVTPPG